LEGLGFRIGEIHSSSNIGG
jgi:hypothetical protein